MASHRLVFLTVMAFLLSLISSSQASFTSDDGVQASTSFSSQKVNISIYYETLSLKCANFIVKTLAKAFENDLIIIINLRLVPWGNAFFNKSSNAIVCQHGEEECRLNTIQACAIDVWHDVNKHFGFIYCIEFLAIEGKQQDWETCFDSLGLPEKHVLDCYNSGAGRMLEFTYGNETAQLSPPQTFVPWVVVNNQPIKHDYENFTSYICKEYKGTVKPKSCEVHIQIRS